MNKLLRLPDVVELTKLAKTTIYRMAKDGSFPKPVKIGKHASGWFEHEIAQWIQDCSSRRYDAINQQGGDSNA